MEKTPVILVRSLKLERGGITRASIKRANLLAKHYKQVLIITILYQQFHNEIINDLYKKKILDKNVKVINFFESLKDKKVILPWKRTKSEHNKIKETGFTEIEVPRGNDIAFRYYRNGFYQKYKRFDENKRLKFIDYMDENVRRNKREEYDEKGNLIRVRHMDKTTNRPRLDRYIDHKGQCFLSVHVNINTNKEEFTVLFNNEKQSYKTLYQLQQEWLEKELNNIKFPVVFCELRRLDKMIMNVKHRNIRKIAVIHANHLSKPYKDINKIESSYKRLFKRIDEFDRVIVFTEEQKEDIEQVYKLGNKCIVIPHAYEPLIPDSNSQGKKIKYNSKTVVTLARYHRDKRIEESIKAFRLVVDKIPDAVYKIYGYGPLEGNLKKLIKELELETNVFLKGFSSNPKSVFQSASCSILTSLREGFGMVITESMAEGTPVISYLIKYGPKDIIKDGVNGFLVKDGDKEELANKIIDILTNDEMRDKLSKNAINIREKFSEKKYKSKWLTFIRSI